MKPLFSGASFVINARDRIALVGKNGAGKSTLLKILCGQQAPTEGTVTVKSGVTVGYLPQVMNVSDDTTVSEEAGKAFAGQDATPWQIAAETERTLTGLGFLRTDFNRPTSEFSGGWRMRIEIAKLLLRHPDVLLLDEPTNHLDIESIRWLETFLAQRPGAVVIVSHDRAFINNVTNRTIEIACGTVTDYRVTYGEFITLRAERREQQRRAYDNQQREIAEMKEFIERFRYKASKAVQVQSRIKQLAKIVPIEIDEVDTSALHLRFPPCLRSGDFPLICEDVRKDYGEHTVISHVNMTIRRGEKVAFVGRNGEGKSTLVKCIMGQVPYTGTLKVGHNVQIGYFAQNQAQLLDERLTAFDTVDRVATGEVRLRIKNILGAFMFGGEAGEKKVSVLSGGERSRLAMIRLLLEPVNFLILDEPTNHLDMQSKDVLKAAIQAFDGTAIIVSHDREFLDGLVTKVYAFSGGTVREHIGGIYDYLSEGSCKPSAMRARSPIAEAPPRLGDSQKITDKREEFATAVQNFAQDKSQKRTEKREAYAERKEQQKALRRAEKAVSDCEAKIAAYEKRLKELDTLLCTPEHAADITLVTEYTSTKRLLDEEMERWEQASELLLN